MEQGRSNTIPKSEEGPTYPIVAIFHTAPNFAQTDICGYIVNQAQYSDPRSCLV